MRIIVHHDDDIWIPAFAGMSREYCGADKNKF
jgi:hypothetical protein